MPGASGITATNWAYTNAPRDGSRILATYSTMLDQNLFGNTKASFDVRKLNWLGSIAKTQLLCVTWHTSPHKDIREMIGKDVTVSATGRTGNTATLPLILNELLGTEFRVISGYSTSGSYLALERGEVDGICGSGISTLRAANPDWFNNKRINLVVQVGLEKHPELPDVPNALDLVTGAKRDVLEFNAIIQEMGRPYAAPPEVPAARLAALNAAFDATMRDSQFLAEADKLGLDVSPLTSADMTRLIDKLYAFAPQTVHDVAAMLGMAEKSEVEHCDRFTGKSERCDKGGGTQ
jgi:tripartite-type tricarboxylate transporter receptor subunit TctC